MNKWKDREVSQLLLGLATYCWEKEKESTRHNGKDALQRNREE